MRCRPGIVQKAESVTIPDQRCTANALHRVRETAENCADVAGAAWLSSKQRQLFVRLFRVLRRVGGSSLRIVIDRSRRGRDQIRRIVGRAIDCVGHCVAFEQRIGRRHK